MERMDDRDSFENEVVASAGSSVRVERAGIIGLTNCEFDAVTGEHLSTTRPHEFKNDFVSMSGIAPGTVVDRVVPCPIIGKCTSCPGRDPETSCDTP